MSDAVTALVDKFVTELRKVIRAELVQSLLAGESLGPTPRKTILASMPAKLPGKRTADTIASQASAALIYIKRHPGCTAAQIAEGLGVELKELKLPIAKLKSDKSLKIAGVRRGTKYSAR